MDKYPDYVYLKNEVERPHIGIINDYRYKWKDAYRKYYTDLIKESNSLLESLPHFKCLE